MHSSSSFFPYSVLKINISNNKYRYILNIYQPSKNKFWDLCINIENYLENIHNNYIDYYIENIVDAHLKNNIIEINYYSENINSCNCSKVNNLIILDNHIKDVINMIFNIYLFDDHVNILLNSNNINSKMFNHIIYLFNYYSLH